MEPVTVFRGSGMGDCLQSFGVLQGFAIMVTVLGLLLLLGALVEGLPQDWKR